MAEINLSSYETTNPRIYAFTTPEIPKNFGLLKIGYTATQTVEERIKQQTHNLRIIPKIEWIKLSPYFNGRFLIDLDFHKFLTKKYKIPRDKEGREWFKISPALALKYFEEFSRGKFSKKPQEIFSESYNLRDEQINAVNMTLKYFEEDKTPREFLWNAKPRFGKNLAVYELIHKLGAKKILILTNRPDIADSWYSDFQKFTKNHGGNFKFVINKKNPLLRYAEVYGKKEVEILFELENPVEIFFISLQDLKGSRYFGGDTDKLEWLPNLHFDLLIIDESHEGVDTEKTYTAFKNIHRNFTLYLSGTPFKAIANKKFDEPQIFNWSYKDEQNAKINWYEKSDAPNPYADLPRMNLFSYQLSKMIDAEILADKDFNYLYDLNEFFATDGKGNFLHKADVVKFLDVLTTRDKFPFSTPELRAELKHTFWLLQRVDSVKALAKLLQEHKIFKDYEIIIAAGNGKLENDDNTNEKSLAKVKAAAKNFEKTITLSVGQLTTGVTIPEWTAVLMLSDFKSAALYFQAAFRAQTPHRYETDNEIFHKTNCYIFDFSPARTLEIYNQFSNSLSKGGGDTETVNELLKVFPVWAEDDAGKMVELDAIEIMSLPQNLKAKDVVDSRFISNELFQNISHVFNTSNAFKKIINKIHGNDNDKDKPQKINPGNTPPPKNKTPGTKSKPDETVAEIVKNLQAAGYEISATLKKKISELVKQNTDAAEIQEKIIAEIQSKQTENDIRDKLRNFARTIPSFIMAYGDDNLTLANFDTYIDDKTFAEVTGISLAEFRILRDGGEYEGEFFEGNIFNETVFNLAVKEFLRRREEYSDYFDENLDKDIFDFIPPQKTSQIFTPRQIVIDMVDALEWENPNIFDNPNQKFFDPYIKSGLYIAEIVKRLYHNKKICAAFPNDAARLKHILENQVYGCAPSNIIFRIATNFIFGKHKNISRRNFHCIDTLKEIQAGTLADCLKKIFSVEVVILNKDRVKKFGEVFTPPEIVNKMLDAEELADVFKTLDAKILEPTAGDGAFLVGILERKLKLAKNSKDAFTALSSIYGIEIQYDNLAYARKNVADTFTAYHENFFGDFDKNAMWQILFKNIVQGDALEFFKNTRPFFEDNPFENFPLKNLKDVIVIGNPPYQADTKGDNKTYAAPVYHLFLESFWKACNRVMMIHPARCLFNAGGTPKKFMQNLLNDEHLKVILYEPDSSKIFDNVDIKGGVAVTYRDENETFGKIEVFIPFPELHSIWQKVFHRADFKSFSEIAFGRSQYRLTQKFIDENPDAPQDVFKNRKDFFISNVFTYGAKYFFDEKPNDDNEYIQVWGLISNKRYLKFIRADYIDVCENKVNFYHYKVIIPQSNGTGAIGEIVSTPLVGLPLVGNTGTFITLGAFDTRTEAANCLKYVKTKFARALLGVLKVTQHNPAATWKYVPLQDFTDTSDVPWSRSVAEIDEYLYQKYKLTPEEIEFIESKVKAMD